MTGALDPVRWVEAFRAIPMEYKAVAVGLVGLYIAFRWWPWRGRRDD